MAAEFDPYRDLLNVETTERPPNHYALLGLPLFEGAREKIDEAAGERMAMLQELATSEYMDASQQLLNEVSAARRCLLDETKKIAYDEDIRSRQRRATTAAGKRGKTSRGRKRRGQPVLPVGIALVVVIILGAVWGLSRGGMTPRNLIVEWPVAQQQGASILLDGEPLEFTISDPVNLNIPKGRHTIVFRRSGYNDIPKTLTFADPTIRLKLTWIPKKP